MEKNDAVQWALIFGVYIWMIFSDVIFAGMREAILVNKIVSMIALIASLFVVEAICQVAASKYFAIKAIIRPSEKVFYFFINRSGITSGSHPKTPNFFTTELPLGVKVKMSRFGKIPIPKVIFKHEFDFDKRMIPSQGKVSYKGNIVQHNSMCTVILYEYPEASTDIDHAEPIPTFYLANAPGDYYLGNVGTSLSNIVSGGNQKVNDYIQRLTLENTQLKQALTEKTRQSSYWHTLSIEIEGANKHLQEELSGLLKTAPNFMRGVVRYAQSYVMAIDDIKQLARTGRFSFLKSWMIYPLLLGLVLMFLGLQPKILQGIGDFMANPTNQLFFIVISLFAVIVFYYYAKARRK